MPARCTHLESIKTDEPNTDGRDELDMELE